MQRDSMYDFNYIDERRLRKPPVSWRSLANHYGKNAANVMRWYKRQVKTRSEKHEVKQTHDSSTRQLSSPAKKTKKLSKNMIARQKNKALSLKRLPKYGRLDPTNYNSGLSFQEWRVHYLNRSPDWILPYITEVEQMYFNCINNFSNEMPFLFRDGGKTFIGMDFITYLIVEYRKTSLCITSGGGSKRRFYNSVRSNIKRANVRRDYGDIIDYENKIDGEIWLKEELRQQNSIDPDIRVAGRGADVIGAHPDIVFLEDFVQQSYKSNESEEGMREWVASVVAPMNAPISGTGTRKNPDDIYQWMDEQGYIKMRVTPALTKEGEYPTREDLVTREAYHPKANKIVRRQMIRSDFDLSEFEWTKCPNYDLDAYLVRRLRNIRAFESEMMQRPIPKEGNVFNKDNFITFNTLPTGDEPRALWVDPAFGQSYASSDTAIIVISIVNRKLMVLDMVVGKFPKTKLRDKLLQVGMEWNTKLVHMENDYSQISNRYNLSEFLPMIIRPFTAKKLTKKESDTTDAKLSRIYNMDTGFDARVIEFHIKAKALKQMESQYLRFNMKKGKWDLLDILASCYHTNYTKLLTFKTQDLYVKSWNSRI